MASEHSSTDRSTAARSDSRSVPLAAEPALARLGDLMLTLFRSR